MIDVAQKSGEGPEVVVTGGTVAAQAVAAEGVASFAEFEKQMQVEAAAAVAEHGAVVVEKAQPAEKSEEIDAKTAEKAQGEAGKEEAEDADGSGEVSADAGKAAAKSGDKPTLSKGQQKKADRAAAAARRTAEADATAARAEATRLREENAALKAGKTEKPGAAVGDVEPNEEDYVYGSLDPEYRKAVRAFDTAQIKKDLLADQQAKAAEARASETAAKYEERVDAFLEKNDDYYEVVEDGLREGKWNLPGALGDVVMDSPAGPDVLYHLATNKADRDRLNAMAPHRQLIEFGKLEAQFAPGQTEKPTPKHRISKADPPVETVRGNGGKFVVNPGTTDFASFEKQYSHLIER